MRIISKEHDYYDRAMGHGQDECVCYLRTRHELSTTPPEVVAVMEPISNSFQYDPIETRDGYFVFAPFVIAFCGNLYRGIKVFRIHKHHDRKTGFIVDARNFYSWTELTTHLDRHKVKLPKKTHYHRNLPLERQLRSHLDAQGTPEIEKYLIESRIVIATYVEAHQRYWFNADVVSYCYERPHFQAVIDDMLGDIGFGHFFDAYSAYQEIDMFISGTLASNTPTPIELTERDRIAQHGYDKWSFRRPPAAEKK
jgi:hypothetical protein